MGCSMKLKFALVTFIITSFAHAGDVRDFSVRGVTPGSDSMQSCDMLSSSFGGEAVLEKLLDIPRNSPDWQLSVDYQIHPGSSDNSNGCDGGYKLYDRKLAGALVRHDYIEVHSQNNLVYYVRNMQQLNVGKTINECTDRRADMVSGLIAKHGKPTIHRKQNGFEHLIWDYSPRPNLQLGDEKFEEYEAFIKCEMYTYGTSFALMKTETKVHSGGVMVDARQVPKAQKTFNAEL